LNKSIVTNHILDVQELAKSIKMMVIEAPEVASYANPGQFVIVIGEETGERIPLTIADFDAKKATVTLVFQEVGKSTLQLGKMKKGDHIAHLNGPLGHSSEIKNFGNVVMIGGGVGIAPIYPITRAMKNIGNHVISIVGSRTADGLFWADRMKGLSDDFYITTNDGSLGIEGFVTAPFLQLIEKKKIDRVVAIGPIPMMKSVAKVTIEHNIPCIVSLNSLMVCGMGMCGACRCKVNDQSHFTCFQGPEFDGNKVDFDELSSRLSMYNKEEKLALNSYQEGK
jgi:ferredoxin--NADP+ reductase